MTMNIFRRLWRWLCGAFSRTKKAETKNYTLVVDGVDSDAWHVVTTHYSPWCTKAGLMAEARDGFTRLLCLRCGNDYGCAAIKTREAYGDGKLEVEARFKGGHGTWPAIWMSHPDGSKDNFSTYYEIDLCEYYETRDVIDTTYHFPRSMRKEENFRHTATPVIKDGWNKFECTWDDEAIQVRINGELALSIRNNDDSRFFPVSETDRTFQIILSMQAGNHWLSEVDLNELPLWMDIRNLKIYKLVK